MLRRQVDVAREEILRHTVAPNRCTCGALLPSNNRNGFAEHLATEVVIALERYALGAPGDPALIATAPVTGLVATDERTFIVDGVTYRTSDVFGSRPLESRAMVGSKVVSYELEVRKPDGGTRILLLTKSEMDGFIESMTGKK